MLELATLAWDIVLRTAVVYLVILIGLRLAGKREIGQMTILPGSAAAAGQLHAERYGRGPDTSLIGGILAAVVLLTLNALVARLRLRWPRLRHLVEGSPTLLVLHGEVIVDHMRREGLDQEALEAALREHGVIDLGEVEMAVLEIDGSISVVPTGTETKRLRRHGKGLRHK